MPKGDTEMGNLTPKTDKLNGKGLFVYAIKTNDKIKKLPGGEKIISTKSKYDVSLTVFASSVVGNGVSTFQKMYRVFIAAV